MGIWKTWNSMESNETIRLQNYTNIQTIYEDSSLENAALIHVNIGEIEIQPL